jgi:hypothetical protein
MSEARKQAVLDAEAARCAAITAGDMTTLAGMLDHDYVHIHGDGRIGDKADYIEGCIRAPRTPKRDNLKVRIFGDSAVLTGDLLNRIDLPGKGLIVIDASATFVLRECAGKWIFVSGQLTPKREIV